MTYRIAVLFVFVGIVIVSLCMGQGGPVAKSQVASDDTMSDHDKIEMLQGKVVELQKELAALTKKYDTHTHQLRSTKVVQIPGSIECNQTVVQWSSTGSNQGPVYKVCRQIGSREISVLVPGQGPMTTGPSRP